MAATERSMGAAGIILAVELVPQAIADGDCDGKDTDDVDDGH
jgi:hypothetical protein